MGSKAKRSAYRLADSFSVSTTQIFASGHRFLASTNAPHVLPEPDGPCTAILSLTRIFSALRGENSLFITPFLGTDVRCCTSFVVLYSPAFSYPLKSRAGMRLRIPSRHSAQPQE